jgi:hypothetical protein
VTPDGLSPLRHKPGPPYGDQLPPSFLKHADEQTVAGLNAVLRAIHDHGLGKTAFTDWGIVAAPRFLGRAALAVALHRFILEGAWGISPHLIPHHSLHSISGTVSQALRIHGPNFGVGGGPHAADEGLLTAVALLTSNSVPGIWLVLTGHAPEFLPEEPDAPGPSNNGHPPPEATNPGASPLGAVALALIPARPHSPLPGLRVGSRPVAEENGAVAAGRAAGAPFSLEALQAALGGRISPSPYERPGAIWKLHCGGWVEWKGPGAGAEN